MSRRTRASWEVTDSGRLWTPHCVWLKTFSPCKAIGGPQWTPELHSFQESQSLLWKESTCYKSHEAKVNYESTTLCYHELDENRGVEMHREEFYGQNTERRARIWQQKGKQSIEGELREETGNTRMW